MCKEEMKTSAAGQQWGLEDSKLGFRAFIFFQQEPSLELSATKPLCHTPNRILKGPYSQAMCPRVAEQQDG